MALDPPESANSAPGYLRLPPGVEIEIEIPPMCVVPGGNEDTAVSVAAAFNTPYFPKLRTILIDSLNERLAAWQ